MAKKWKLTATKKIWDVAEGTEVIVECSIKPGNQLVKKSFGIRNTQALNIGHVKFEEV